MNRHCIALISIIILIIIMVGCNPEMEPKTVITTGTNGISVTNVVMVKKDNSAFWIALAEALAEVAEEIDFGDADFDFE